MTSASAPSHAASSSASASARSARVVTIRTGPSLSPAITANAAGLAASPTPSVSERPAFNVTSTRSTEGVCRSRGSMADRSIGSMHNAFKGPDLVGALANVSYQKRAKVNDWLKPSSTPEQVEPIAAGADSIHRSHAVVHLLRYG